MPFKRSVPVAYSAEQMGGHNTEILRVLSDIDKSRLDPPNQYFVAELRKFTSALNIPRMKKQIIVDIIKQKLRATDMM